ncbi:hypothetical protein HYDPIDRAFT_28014 [Hydnomerulius pinastri MD-312]|uniref:WD40 repeat-like protein n=1 Tax=Hydnomerulius pinastri MD-312 TaxID=994086 RepID=A0A0C9W2M7_9AGAM|nr:hypothetical protein HYDPIDRAFT_28014 [Hydnomerulius pinastri MD-312]
MFRGNGPSVARGFHDATANLPGVRSPYARMESGVPRRKQTLLSIIDRLTEMSNDSPFDAEFSSPSVSEEDLPTSLDEKLQNTGAELFYKFEKRVDQLDKELRNFANAARQLGSSVGILSSAFKLRERLTKIQFLFRENAASLFPRRINRQPREALLNPNLMDRRRRTNWRSNHPPAVAKLILEDNLEPETLPKQFESFAQDVVTFLNCLNEFPEFTDEAVNQSMRGFEGDLKYWASCLHEYKNQFRSPAVQRYVHDLTTEIGDHIDNITGTLSMFIEIGVPTIRFHQQHAATNLLNLSTVATFFSAVTATTLQFSYNATGNVLSDSVNAFWFSSLVFSIAAAVNSLLGLTWKQAMYRSPGHRVPWWVLIWIKRSPLVFLVMSVACFSAGLMLFTYSSGQGPVTSTIITVLTASLRITRFAFEPYPYPHWQAVTSFGLAAVSAWFASERWIFVQHRGQKWLGEVISEATNRMGNLPPARGARIALHWCSTRLAIAQGYLRRLTDWVSKGKKPEEGLPSYDQQTTSLPRSHRQPRPYPPDTMSTTPKHEAALSVCSDSTERPLSSEGRSEESSGSGHSDARQRFKNAIRSVIMLQSSARPMSPRRDSSWETPLADRAGISALSPGRFSDPGMSALRGGRVASSVDKLKSLVATQEMAAHLALVRHLQFSPNGRYLATSSWDRTTVIFRVGETLSTHRILVHVRGFIGQVAWSPNGRILLTRLTRAVKVWSEEGVCLKTIERQNPVTSIIWLPIGEGFLSVEGSDVVKLDLHGKVLDTYHLGEVRLSNVAVTSDCKRLIGVGPSIFSPTGPQPSRHTRVEKRIIDENQGKTPFANDVRDISMSRKTPSVLISPEKAPPQLWKLETIRDRDRSELAYTSRLSLKHTFALKGPVDIAGPCHFGGKDDQFVLCAGKAGDIHIWDRETAALLHCLRPSNEPGAGDLTCIAWNYATDEPMTFATGSHDGTVRIWSTAPLDSRSERSSYMDGRSDGDRTTGFSLHSGG